MADEMRRARLVKTTTELMTDFDCHGFKALVTLIDSIQEGLLHNEDISLDNTSMILGVLEVVTDKFYSNDDVPTEEGIINKVMNYLVNGGSNG